MNVYATLAVMGYTTNAATFTPICNKLNEIGSPLLYDCQFLRDMVGTLVAKECIGISGK